MHLPILPAAVIFDMDGLLFDTETLYQEAFVLAAAEAGHDMAPAMFQRMLGSAWPHSRALLLEHYGAAFPVDDFRTAWTRHFKALAATRLSLKPGAVELLDTLDLLGLPRAIATSSRRSTAQHHLAAHHLIGRFDAIVAQGDYAASKPAPDAYLKAAEALRIAPHLCLALEDSFNGIRSASTAGMMTIMVPDLLQPTDEIRALCTLVVEDLYVVRQLIAAAAEASPLP